jgi:hypothetical protein
MMTNEVGDEVVEFDSISDQDRSSKEESLLKNDNKRNAQDINITGTGCLQVAQEYAMKEFRSSCLQRYGRILHDYISQGEKQIFPYPAPSEESTVAPEQQSQSASSSLKEGSNRYTVTFTCFPNVCTL